ncbi:unnamed protein product [Sphacelaria rigidula]
MAVRWGVQRFRPYIPGRRFQLFTDCSALVLLFRSRDLCPKLHRCSVGLTEYIIDLQTVSCGSYCW